MTGAREEALEHVLYIHYPVQFKNFKTQVQALVDLRSEANAIYPSFTKQLGLHIRPTNVGSQKIDGTMLDIYGIIVAPFSVENKANQVRFFAEIFLVVNVSPELVFGIPFLTLSNADIDFSGRELRWRTYIIKKALPTTKHVELVEKKEFATAVPDPEHETYVVHIATLSSTSLASFRPTSLNVDPFQRPQISGLIAEEAPTKVPAKYLDFADIFSPDLASKLREHSGINDHAIEIVKSC